MSTSLYSRREPWYWGGSSFPLKYHNHCLRHTEHLAANCTPHSCTSCEYPMKFGCWNFRSRVRLQALYRHTQAVLSSICKNVGNSSSSKGTGFVEVLWCGRESFAYCTVLVGWVVCAIQKPGIQGCCCFHVCSEQSIHLVPSVKPFTPMIPDFFLLNDLKSLKGVSLWNIHATLFFRASIFSKCTSAALVFRWWSVNGACVHRKECSPEFCSWAPLRIIRKGGKDAEADVVWNFVCARMWSTTLETRWRRGIGKEGLWESL